MHDRESKDQSGSEGLEMRFESGSVTKGVPEGGSSFRPGSVGPSSGAWFRLVEAASLPTRSRYCREGARQWSRPIVPSPH